MKNLCVPKKPYNDLLKLPPESGLISSVSIWKAEARARAALAELKGLAHIIPNQSILVNAIVLQEAQDSSEIENIITTRDKLYNGFFAGQQKIDVSTKEVINYREALMKGFNLISKQGFLRLSNVNEIQSVIVGNIAGLRKTSGTALVNEKTKEVVFTPPDPQYIDSLLSNLLDYFNTSESTLISMAVMHFQFETIHPYYDGNGRTGRILNILYLIGNDLLDTPILYLSSYITKNKAEYYRLLNEVTISQVWDNWIVFILEGVYQVAVETIEKIQLIKKELDRVVELVKVKMPKSYSKDLVETLFENPYCKVDFIIRSVGVERKAASRYLNQLVELNVLSKHKVGKENIFINDGLMEILKA